MSLLTTAVFLSVFVFDCESARILAVFPTPSISHQVVFRPYTLELAKRGHDVVVITTDPMFVRGQTPVNYTEIDVHDLSYNTWQALVIAGSSQTLTNQEYLKFAMSLLTTIVIKQLEIPEVQNLLKHKDQVFDLLILEACARPALLWSHLYKAPVIQISSFGTIPGIFNDVGIPIHPDFYPMHIRRKINNLTLWNRITEYYYHYSMKKVYDDQKELDHLKMMDIFGSNFPSLNELKTNIDMTFINIRPSWDFNRPKVPSVVYLGGLHESNSNVLHEEITACLESSTKGVIYMSFGTNVKSSDFPPHVIKLFLNVFASLPYDILWKWDKDELEGRPKNVKISKWFPQSDLLKHPKIKLFITQGGLQSTDEAIIAGVPVIGIPIVSDQFYNTELYTYYSIGIKLDIETMSEEDLKKAINTTLEDKSYRANIIKLRTLMFDEPQTALERAIWLTEYVLKNGGAKHLRAPAADMSWAEYYELELISIILIVFMFVVKIILFFINTATKSLSNVYYSIKIKTN